MNADERSRLERGLGAALAAGAVAVPALLLKYYVKLGLSDAEAMLLVHLLQFREREGKEFPTHGELQARMAAAPEAVIAMIQKLLQAKLVTIDEKTDPLTGVKGEQYNLQPLLARLAGCWLEEANWLQPPPEPPPEPGKDLFSIFENEFARPLTPMECEMIVGWIDKEHYAEPLILAALKEAVFAGKVHFRYIDRILLDWRRNRVFNSEQAKEYAQRYRGRS